MQFSTAFWTSMTPRVENRSYRAILISPEGILFAIQSISKMTMSTTTSLWSKQHLAVSRARLAR